MNQRDPQEIIDRLVARGIACRVSSIETEADRIVAAQDAMETGSQVVGEDDEYA